QSIQNALQTQVFYEAPHRIRETLEDIVEVLGTERNVVIAREVTKIHEEFLRGTASKLLETLKSRGEVKGEITLLLGKAEEGERKSTVSQQIKVSERLAEIMTAEKLDEKAALKKVAREMGISRSEAYRQWQRSKLAGG